jgi:hypothetical protein
MHGEDVVLKIKRKQDHFLLDTSLVKSTLTVVHALQGKSPKYRDSKS